MGIIIAFTVERVPKNIDVHSSKRVSGLLYNSMNKGSISERSGEVLFAEDDPPPLSLSSCPNPLLRSLYLDLYKRTPTCWRAGHL